MRRGQPVILISRSEAADIWNCPAGPLAFPSPDALEYLRPGLAAASGAIIIRQRPGLALSGSKIH
jgi:hypothetical protein